MLVRRRRRSLTDSSGGKTAVKHDQEACRRRATATMEHARNPFSILHSSIWPWRLVPPICSGASPRWSGSPWVHTTSQSVGDPEHLYMCAEGQSWGRFLRTFCVPVLPAESRRGRCFSEEKQSKRENCSLQDRVFWNRLITLDESGYWLTAPGDKLQTVVRSGLFISVSISLVRNFIPAFKVAAVTAA